ncbi:MAG: PASTA domain-containing protein, partial [Treponema sp.]|nr:PASTA domain-containing protein [Treponema sp.]
MNVSETYEKVQSNVPLYIGVAIASFFVVVMAAVATFFLTVKGPEQVLVPNVVGKQLEDALLEMQVKELYPKINLRYSDVPGDEGSILEQNPPAGAIVKGYSRVSLVVSRGVVVDKLGNYVGQNYDDVVLSLQTLFAGQTKPLIVLGTPQYKPDLS